MRAYRLGGWATFRALNKVVLILGLLVAGCAYAEVRPIKSTDVEGIRFYRPWPYLWVTQAEKGGCALTITYLPDTSQEYIIIPHTGVGTLKVAPTLAEGWNLVAFDVQADSKVAELVSSITGLAGQIATKAFSQVATTNFGQGLYRLEFKDGKVSSLAEVFHLQDSSGNRLGCRA